MVVDFLELDSLDVVTIASWRGFSLSYDLEEMTFGCIESHQPGV